MRGCVRRGDLTQPRVARAPTTSDQRGRPTRPTGDGSRDLCPEPLGDATGARRSRVRLTASGLREFDGLVDARGSAVHRARCAPLAARNAALLPTTNCLGTSRRRPACPACCSRSSTADVLASLLGMAFSQLLYGLGYRRRLPTFPAVIRQCPPACGTGFAGLCAGCRLVVERCVQLTAQNPNICAAVLALSQRGARDPRNRPRGRAGRHSGSARDAVFSAAAMARHKTSVGTACTLPAASRPARAALALAKSG